ncbi:ATP-binding protein [Streptomyces sp. NPDC020742]|uniref:ATP-binding protein n=1 Tax=Streptomyces sp. NPDC020742 TaxID=3154897 RepID=UPI0034065B7F
MSDTVPGPRVTSTQGVTPHGTLLPALTSRSAQHAVLVLPAQDACVRSARRFAAALLAWWALSADDQDTAVLIVSELTTNAAQHGHSDMTIRLTLDPDMLHIAVADHGDVDPSTLSHPDDDPDEHGRGLHIVHALTARLDIHQGSAGRQVHASLRITPPQLAAAGDTNPRQTLDGSDPVRNPPTRPRRHTCQSGTVAPWTLTAQPEAALAHRPKGRQLPDGPRVPVSALQERSLKKG